MDLYIMIGTLGLLILLTGFILNLAGRLGSESVWYLSLNIMGCLLLTFYAIELDSLPFMILEGVWGISSLVKLVIILRRRG